MSVARGDITREQNTVISVLDSHAQAEHIIRELEKSGVDMRMLSIVAKGYHTEEQPVGYYTFFDRFKRWAGLGLAWGALWGVLFGILLFWLPEFGPLYVDDPFLNVMFIMFEGAAIGAVVGTLAAAFSTASGPRRRPIKFETRLRADKYLVVAHGTPEDITRARQVIEQHDAAHREVAAA